MVMQIHGRLTRAQRDLIHNKDYDAPPLLKIYYNNGQIEVAHKKLKESNIEGNDLLIKANWNDAEHYFFDEFVNNEKFGLTIRVNREKFTVVLNNTIKDFVHPDLRVWPFDNYFKAGNYLTSSSSSAYSEVKFYQLKVIH